MSSPGAVTHFRSVEPLRTDGSATYLVHSDPDSSGLELRVIAVDPCSEAARKVDAGHDDVLYVASGSGTLVVEDERETPLEVGTGCLVNGPAGYSLRSGGEPLQVAIVTGRIDSDTRCAEPVRIVDVASQPKQAAVSNREFQVLFDPGRGCSGMTQFLGYVPQVRTPRHYHPYDEMIFIVQGRGTVEIEGREAPVAPGDCYFLPRGCVHLVQNTDEEFLVELGVFTPAGSPTQNTPVE